MKTTKTTKKKLSLGRETLRTLSRRSLEGVNGGTSNFTETLNCPPPASGDSACSIGCSGACPPPPPPRPTDHGCTRL